jgi:hypothetical protein
MTTAVLQGAGVQGGPPVGVIIVAILGSIPIIGIVAWTAVKIFGPIGQAFSRRLSGGGDSQLESRVDALAEELEQVRAQLAETHERLDFTERLLAQGRHPDQLPGKS